ncbi:MAG: NAD(P)-dependent alcohol dehydrogenase [Chloroflexota bacterium]
MIQHNIAIDHDDQVGADTVVKDSLKMKAIVYENYGSSDVLNLSDVPKPSPKDDEVLVKVHATGLNRADWYLLTGRPLMLRAEAGLFRPKNPILGSDIAGVVESVGKNVSRFKVGDAVYGDLSEDGRSGLAEYVCAPEKVLGHKLAGLSFSEAAAVPMAAMTALQGIADNGKIQAGQSVLINGASGGVGTYAVQIAKAMGAEVTAVCSTSKIDMVRQIGADHVIDYTKEDFTKSGKQYDLIFAANGFQTLAEYRQVLTPTGTYVCAGGAFRQIFAAMLFGRWAMRGTQKSVKSYVQKPIAESLEQVTALIESGHVRPVMDQQYRLEHAANGLRYLGEGSPKGKVVINIVPCGS